MNIQQLKKKNLSIAFVVHTFIPESYGGAEKQTLRLTSNLKVNNVEAIILAPRLKKETPSEIESLKILQFWLCHKTQ